MRPKKLFVNTANISDISNATNTSTSNAKLRRCKRFRFLLTRSLQICKDKSIPDCELSELQFHTITIHIKTKLSCYNRIWTFVDKRILTLMPSIINCQSMQDFICDTLPNKLSFDLIIQYSPL